MDLKLHANATTTPRTRACIQASTSANEGKNKFTSRAERDAFLHAFVRDYNHTNLRCLGYIAPLQALCNLPRYNICAGISHRGEMPASPGMTPSGTHGSTLSPRKHPHQSSR